MPVDVQPNQNFDIFQWVSDFVTTNPKLAGALIITAFGVWFLRKLLSNRLAMTTILVVVAIFITVAITR